MSSPIGTPNNYKKSKRVNPREPTMEAYTPINPTKVSIFEAQKPNKVTRAVDPFDSTIGERPPVPFSLLFDYRDKTPQIDSIIEYMVDLIVGTEMNINVNDDNPDAEAAKELLDKFASEIDLFGKVKQLTDDSLTAGTALFARVFTSGVLTNIEQFDITTLKRVKRDEYGNVKAYLVDNGTGGEVPIKGNIQQIFVPLIFRPRGRDFFGRSIFHGLAVERNLGNRTTRPIVEALWSLDDVVVGTLENFAYPIEYHTFDGINDNDLEIEAQKMKELKPGDRLFLSRMHEIDRREPTQAKFDPFFEHTSNIVQLGTGFPLEILLGDFTSKASSQTTDSLLMRRIKAFQQHLMNVVKTEILEKYIQSVKGSRWETPEALAELSITINFETSSQMEYTPDMVLSRVNSGMWTEDEGRQFDKTNGQDLFDDDEIAKRKEEKDEERKANIASMQDAQKKKDDRDDTLEAMAKLSNSMLMKDVSEGIKKND